MEASDQKALCGGFLGGAVVGTAVSTSAALATGVTTSTMVPVAVMTVVPGAAGTIAALTPTGAVVLCSALGQAALSGMIVGGLVGSMAALVGVCSYSIYKVVR